MSTHNIHRPLNGTDSIRILELNRGHRESTPFSGRLITTQLSKRPEYTALSYVWGEPSPEDPMLMLNGQPLQIRASLWQALSELTAHGNAVKLWVDQICINQENQNEQEQQVQMMSEIYKKARLVTCWLGVRENDSDLAFHLFGVLGQLLCEDDSGHDQQNSLEWQSHTSALMEAGRLHDVDDLFNPNRRPVLQRPWFRRLWVVQEVALACALELRCGSSLISGSEFFEAIRKLSSAVTDPPMPWLLKPYRNALKLGQLRAQVSAKQNHSFPHLAHKLSEWNCKRSHD